jgi:hypothetical protein
LGLKTGSSGLVIWVLKSPQWFLGSGLKIKQTSVYRLRHKTDVGRSAWDTRRDLVAGFAWKQVWQGFPSLACTWHHQGGCVQVKLKTDGSMRRAASDPVTPSLLFLMY